jgi:hypothetical protein
MIFCLLHRTAFLVGFVFVYLVQAAPIKKAPQARVGSHPLHRGREGVGEEESRSEASSQVESEGSEPPPFFKSIWCCCAMSFLSYSSYEQIINNIQKIIIKLSHSPHPRLRVSKHIKIISSSEHPFIDILL